MTPSRTRHGSFYRRRGKRALDLAIAVPAALVLAPLAFALAALVAVLMGRPVLYRQLRPGRDAEPFELLKLRTMTTADDRQPPLPDIVRLTPLGRFLRRWSLDELPQIWNVVRGDMSLVGPRPLLMEYLPRYDARQARRHELPPGITGWAQIHGRNAQSWRERLELDVWYTENLTLALDLAILARSVVTVLRGDGVTASDAETMPRFEGRGHG